MSREKANLLDLEHNFQIIDQRSMEAAVRVHSVLYCMSSSKYHVQQSVDNKTVHKFTLLELYITYLTDTTINKGIKSNTSKFLFNIVA